MNEAKFENEVPLQLDNFSDLLGKKSVKATFRLRPKVISVLSILSTQLGIKQKSLFDFLMEDVKALHAIARSLTPDRLDKDKRIRKTFVVSQKSLSTLKAVAEQFSASRDDIVELSIQRLLPVFKKEHRRQSNRERAFAKIKEHFIQGKPLMDEIRQLVENGKRIYKLPIEFIKKDN